jgi:pyruvate kinase
MLYPVNSVASSKPPAALRKAAIPPAAPEVSAIRFGISLPDTRPKRTQIVASLGPSSREVPVLEAMIRAGASVFRIDFARGTHGQHAETIRRVREATENVRQSGQQTHPVKIMADLQGPRIAVGDWQAGPRDFKKDETVQLSAEPVSADPAVLPVTFPALVTALKAGERLIINDGDAVLKVTKPPTDANGQRATAKVVKPGKVGKDMVINAPDTDLNTPALTEKDKADLKFALAQGVEIITQSFPASDADVEEARALIQEAGKKATLIAKIERPQAVAPRMLRAITRAADGVMVARGDLGTEMGVESLPELQKRIVDEAKLQHKFVVVANKLLGTMMHRDQPGRSDVFDLVQAIQSGAEMVMLTGETAAGPYPVEAVRVADNLVNRYGPQNQSATPVEGGLIKQVLGHLRAIVHGMIDGLFDAIVLWVEDMKTMLSEKFLGRFAKKPEESAS